MSGGDQSLEDLCQNCKHRLATENWVGEGGMIGYIHGMYARWCKVCVLEKQCKHIRDSIALLGQLEKELREEYEKEKL